MAWVTAAPSSMASPVRVIVESSGTREMSTTTFGSQQPHVQHRHEALAAGEHAGIVAVLGEHLDRLFHRGGANVVEAGWFHPRYSATFDAGGVRLLVHDP